MNFMPAAEYVLVRRLKKQENSSDKSFVVPKHLQPNYAKATGTEVVAYEFHSSSTIKKDSLLAVEATMLEDFVHDGKTYTIIHEKYIKGRFE